MALKVGCFAKTGADVYKFFAWIFLGNLFTFFCRGLARDSQSQAVR